MCMTEYLCFAIISGDRHKRRSCGEHLDRQGYTDLLLLSLTKNNNMAHVHNIVAVDATLSEKSNSFGNLSC